MTMNRGHSQFPRSHLSSRDLCLTLLHRPSMVPRVAPGAEKTCFQRCARTAICCDQLPNPPSISLTPLEKTLRHTPRPSSQMTPLMTSWPSLPMLIHTLRYPHIDAPVRCRPRPRTHIRNVRLSSTGHCRHCPLLRHHRPRHAWRCFSHSLI